MRVASYTSPRPWWCACVRCREKSTSTKGLSPYRLRALASATWRGRYGFGALQIDGHIGLKDLKPDAYNVQLHATDIPCRTPELLLEANADVHVGGTGASPMVKGKIDITRGRYIKRFDLHDFYVQAKPGAASVALKDKAPALEGVGLDVHVGTSNELVVNVDAGIFAVKTDLQADLHVTGNVVYPKINGNLRAEGGTLKFPEASLTLTERPTLISRRAPVTPSTPRCTCWVRERSPRPAPTANRTQSRCSSMATWIKCFWTCAPRPTAPASKCYRYSPQATRTFPN